eukprot:CAMPEP_0116952430 /NCGR_PEP_ID=MMETSP0467-20121206/40732_1 /TAXON_ID=283647 /ORGANISM="Mesodinium pulex, Strain SPMC105" /LENGTH=345 /DNA_ID=CAMNT_0004637709 /DNA_START=497 /DNA_END=1533 /DNA_ORIENTATION=+
MITTLALLEHGHALDVALHLPNQKEWNTVRHNVHDALHDVDHLDVRWQEAFLKVHELEQKDAASEQHGVEQTVLNQFVVRQETLPGDVHFAAVVVGLQGDGVHNLIVVLLLLVLLANVAGNLETFEELVFLDAQAERVLNEEPCDDCTRYLDEDAQLELGVHVLEHILHVGPRNVVDSVEHESDVAHYDAPLRLNVFLQKHLAGQEDEVIEHTHHEHPEHERLLTFGLGRRNQEQGRKYQPDHQHVFASNPLAQCAYKQTSDQQRNGLREPKHTHLEFETGVTHHVELGDGVVNRVYPFDLPEMGVSTAGLLRSARVPFLIDGGETFHFRYHHYEVEIVLNETSD